MRYLWVVVLLLTGLLISCSLTRAQQAEVTDASAVYIVHGRDALGKAVPVGKIVDNTRGFFARVAYDDQSLYVLYEVMSPYELTNSYADWQTVFKGGNCLDIQIGTDAQADPARTEPVPGDVRVLVTRQQGKTLAVIYRPKVKNFTGKPIVFTTVNQISFDSIARCDTVQIQEYRKFPNGFLAVVAIPLSVLDWAPKPGTRVKMDLGYRFGNVTGNQIVLRAYWRTNSFNSNVIYDVPCESRLEPNLWGTAVVE